MNINNLIETGRSVQLVISAADLKEAFMAWSEQNSTEDWLPTSVVVEKYHISKQTLQNYRKHGLLTPVRRGVEMHYRLSELSKIWGE
jgi:hypothetical protein